MGNIIILDHAPVTATIALLSGKHRAWSLRLNESLLDDAAGVSGVMDVLTHYFTFKGNNTEGISKGIIWEGHKVVVVGGAVFFVLQAQESQLS